LGPDETDLVDGEEDAGGGNDEAAAAEGAAAATDSGRALRKRSSGKGPAGVGNAGTGCDGGVVLNSRPDEDADDLLAGHLNRWRAKRVRYSLQLNAEMARYAQRLASVGFIADPEDEEEEEEDEEEEAGGAATAGVNSDLTGTG
jgi:xanthine/CO dehydrogenase XdhC/CoxF family maturation factor